MTSFHFLSFRVNMLIFLTIILYLSMINSWLIFFSNFFFLCILWFSWWHYPPWSHWGWEIWSHLWSPSFFISFSIQSAFKPCRVSPALLFSIPTVITPAQACIISLLQYCKSYQLLSVSPITSSVHFQCGVRFILPSYFHSSWHASAQNFLTSKDNVQTQ